MLQYSLEVGICWAILYLIYIAFLRRETFFSINRWYLLGSLIVGLLIPVLRTIPIAFREEVIVVNDALYFIAAGPELIASNFVSPEEAKSILTMSNLLLLVYSLGVLFVGSRLVVGLLKINNLYTSGKRTNKGSFILVETPKFHLPFSFLNCVFFSKEMPINSNIEKILKHELAHVQSWHTLDVLFIEVLQVVFWFNPLIVLYKKAIKESHEYVADASVLQDTSRKIYGQILLRQSQSGLQIALANHFFHSHIKNRLTMMKQKKSKRPALVKYLFALPAILLLVILFQSQTVPNPEVEESQTTQGIRLFEGKETDMTFEERQKYKGVEFLSEERAVEILGERARGRHVVNILDTKDYVFDTPEVKSKIYHSETGWRFSYTSVERGIIKIRSKDKDFKRGEIIEYEKENEKLDISLQKFIDESQIFQLWAVGENNNSIETAMIDFMTGAAFDPFSQEAIPTLIPIRKEDLKKDIDKSSGYGMRMHPVLKKSKKHNGIDLIAEMNTPIYAAGDGVVNEVRYDKDYGNLITIEHKNGYSTFYAHLSSYNVFKGDDIKKGQQIGRVGSTGLSTTPHLHYEVKINSKPIDPSPFLKEYLHVQNMFGEVDMNRDTLPEGVEALYKEDEVYQFSSKMLIPDGMKNPLFVINGKVQDSEQELYFSTDRHINVVPLNSGEAKRKYKRTDIDGAIEITIDYIAQTESVKQNFDSPPPPPPNPPSIDEVWNEISKNKEIGIHIDGEIVSAAQAFALRDKLKLQTIGMQNPHGRNIELVKFVTKVNGVSGESLSLNKIDSVVFKIVQQMPRFPGCEELEGTNRDKEECGKKEMLEFIYTNLNYPAIARVNGIQGTNVIQFIVERDGRLSDLNLVRDIGGGTGEETMKVMRKMQEEYTWTPGYQKGKAVKVLFTLPIKFKLDESDTECCENEDDKKILGAQDELRPLFIVDGEEIGIGPFDLNPDQIRTVNVFKGDEATKKYGTKAKHGVVLIETKDGKYDVRNITVPNPKPTQLVDGEILKVVEEMPHFPGCEEIEGTHQEKVDCGNKKMLEFIYKNLKYPAAAIVNGVEGTNVVQYVVEKDGSISGLNLVRDIGGGTGEATMKVIEKMQAEYIWTPGNQNGETVRVLFTLPVNFKLADNDDDFCDEEDKSSTVKSTIATSEYNLYQNKPNPFRTYTDISFELPSNARAQITVYDFTGKVVRTVNDQFNRGLNTVRFTKSELGAAAGVLYYELESGEFKLTRKMIVAE